MRVVTFVGAPSTGKGSFGKKIADRIEGWVHLSLGDCDCMRKEIAERSTLGMAIASSMEGGRLVSDSLANKVAIQNLKYLQEKKMKAVILDGYPRTIDQAVAFKEEFSNLDFSAVHIMLERWVAIEKTLGRQGCTTCGGNFNAADILTDGFEMPAIIPDPGMCATYHKNGKKCLIQTRQDDTKELVEIRYDEYLLKTTPLLKWLDEQGLLKTFNVKKGMADADILMDMIVDQKE